MDQNNQPGPRQAPESLPVPPPRPGASLNVPPRQASGPANAAYNHDFSESAVVNENDWGPAPETPAAPAPSPPVSQPALGQGSPQTVPGPPAALPAAQPATPPKVVYTAPVSPPPGMDVAPPPPSPPPPPPKIATLQPPSADGRSVAAFTPSSPQQPSPVATPLPAAPAPPTPPPLTTPPASNPAPTAVYSPPPSSPPVAAPVASQTNYGNVQHLPPEIAERIGGAKQQNSKEIAHDVSRRHYAGWLKGLFSLTIFLAGIFIAALLINQFIFQSYYVNGSSMEPTLQNDDRLIIDKTGRTLALVQGKPYVPERGQIVVLDSSIIDIDGQNTQLIKRVVGLPGDTVVINDGVVKIKNASNPEGFNVNDQLGLNLEPTYWAVPLEVTVGEGQVFVLGDNRAPNKSHDSRAFGPIETNKLVGRLWARVLPLNNAALY